MSDNTLDEIISVAQGGEDGCFCCGTASPENASEEAKAQLTQMVKEIIGSSPSHYDDECSPDNGCFCMAGQEIAVKEEQKQRARKYGLEIE